MNAENLEKLTNIVRVTYTAYDSLSPNAVGYVRSGSLHDPEDGVDMESWEEGEDAPILDGWTQVKADDESRYAVRDVDMWSEVVEDDRLEGGWGMPYPLGGMTGWGEPTACAEISDEDGTRKIYLSRQCW